MNTQQLEVVQDATGYLSANPTAPAQAIAEHLVKEVYEDLSIEEALAAAQEAIRLHVGETKQTTAADDTPELTSDASGAEATADTVAAARVRQPDANGEFLSPLDGALWMAQTWHVPQIPLLPKSKNPILKDWPSKATTDPEQIRTWAAENPNCNFGSVALDKFIIFETDSPEVAQRFKQQAGTFTSRLLIMSSKGGHRYYLAAPGLIDKTIGQNDTLHADFSLRLGNAYCVTVGSIHPTGAQYRAVMSPANDWPGVPTAPTQQEIDFWLSEKISEKSTSRQSPSINGDLIPRGKHDTELTRIAGKLRQDGMEKEALIAALTEICEKRCIHYGPDYREMCQKIATSICRYPIKNTTVLVDGVPAGSASVSVPSASVASVNSAASATKFEIDTSEDAARPEFPRWIMQYTSLYEGLAKPVSDANSKYPELIWMAAVQCMLNYLHGKVRIEGLVPVNLNTFLGIVSPPGKFFKSSSCRLAHDYFKLMGLLDSYTGSMTTSNGQVMVTSAGSSEGLGIQMQRVNAKHAILFNDELGKLAAKAGIENSSFAHDVLQWYEGAEFSNLVTNRNSCFTCPAGSYCFGWQWATTTRGFDQHWPKIAGIVSGLEDRMFFLLTPKQPKPIQPEQYVSCHEASVRTKQLIDRAISQGVYSIVDSKALAEQAASFGDPRSMNMVYKFALYFAIDLGVDTIDDLCVERAMALVKYRQQATAFLAPIEAENQQARVQQEIMRVLRRAGGRMTYRELCQQMHTTRLGSWVWKTSYEGLIELGDIFEFKEPCKTGDRRVVAVRKWNEGD